jgi:putative cardiolipin synthase
MFMRMRLANNRGRRPRSALARGAAAGAFVVALLLGSCTSLPPPQNRSVTHAIEAPADSRLRAAIDPLAAAHPTLTGIYPLKDGPGAFAARVALIDVAVSSVDVQYYIWHDDLTGRLMFDALRRAAERGVRIRLLLDDLTTRGGLDDSIAALLTYPGVEVRLFNPFKQRTVRGLGFLTDFSRLNRRMHNKSLTVDGVATIVGGRNVADEYFQAGDDFGYVDLDVLAVGAAVADVARSFDQFWRSDSSYPATQLLEPASAKEASRRVQFWQSARQEPAAARYAAAIQSSQLVRELSARELHLEWAPAHVVADDAAKGLGKTAKGDELLQQFQLQLRHRVATEFLIVSPFFVPRTAGQEMLVGFAQRGVHVKVLTNGAESADVAAAVAAYRTYRKALLQAGVELFELKRRAAVASSAEREDTDESLHAKTIGIDRAQIFVGSFNFDPRSANLNTEIGLVIDSPSLATALSQAFEEVVPTVAYQVQLDSAGQLAWHDRGADGHGARALTDEPGAGFWRRMWLGFLAVLPIEGNL